MKSATTTMFDLLAQHPQLCAARIKEPDFFSTDRAEATPAAYRALWDWNPGRHTVALEASVSYTKLPYVRGVPERIEKAALGDVRFIYLMRHPIARIESQLRHALFGGWGHSLDQGLDPDLVAFSRYATQLDAFRERFGTERLLPLLLDDLEQSPVDCLRRVCTFLEVDATFSFPDVTRRRNRGDLYTAQPWVGSMSRNQWVRQLLNRMPIGAKASVRTLLARLRPVPTDTAVKTARWQLSADERRQLWRLLADDMARLETDYGISVPPTWRAPDA